MPDVVLATCDPLPEPDPDAAPLTEALARAGVPVRWAAWDADARVFDDAALVVLRSTWDYIHRPKAFVAWAARMGGKLVNPPEIVRWNHHKGYLLELERAGLPVVPTALVKRGERVRLTDLLASRGWDDAVVKPAISAGSFETHRVRRGAGEPAFFENLVAAHDTLVQPYLASVETYGERSLVTIDGELTHAVRKTPRFSGQHEAIGGGAQEIAPDERAFALRALALGESLGGARVAYGRVDMARDDAGRLLLMELELIEPSLFFDRAPPALERFVRLVKRLYSERI